MAKKDLVCYRKKQSFRHGQLVLKPSFRPKGTALGMYKKSKISRASDQYFLNYVKKNYGGGVKLTPSPSRNRVKITIIAESLTGLTPPGKLFSSRGISNLKSGKGLWTFYHLIIGQNTSYSRISRTPCSPKN